MKKNQTIRNNATGETLTMLISDEENHGACQLYEVCLPPHCPSPPLHYHVDFTETFTVKQGKLDFYVDRDQKHLLLQPGESATAEIRQPHRCANKTKPAGGVVKAFQLAYGISNNGGAQRRFAKESHREAYICQDHPRLPSGYPTSTSESRFQLCRLLSKSCGARQGGNSISHN
jgi:quercetin dioxygenase-like cupin family protein